MIGLDTNVLIRYLVQDDAAQAARANALIGSFSGEEPGFVSLIVLVETSWVLTGLYDVGRSELAKIIGMLLATRELRLEQADIIRKALTVFETSRADFADCLIGQSGVAAGCNHTATFDVKAAKITGMVLV